MTKARELADVIGTQSTTENVLQGRRNLIINGAMQVAQRGTSFSNDGWAADRFKFNGGSLEQFSRTISNSTDAPDGFSNSIKSLTTTAETSIEGSEFYRLYYTLEGQDCQHLAYGTSEAKTVTLSFYVKSNVTGTYAVSMYSYNSDKIIGGTYTINSADTWEQKTISFVGDTAATIQNTNTGGLRIQWGLIVGPDRTGGSNSSWATYVSANQFAGHTADWGEDVNDYFQITGVQLEVGSVATPFEHRSYGEELALCQRYYQRVGSTTDGITPIYAIRNTTNQALMGYSAVQCLRATPTVAMSGSFTLYGGGSTESLGAVAAVVGNQIENRQVTWTQTATGISNNISKTCYGYNAYFEFDAEL